MTDTTRKQTRVILRAAKKFGDTVWERVFSDHNNQFHDLSVKIEEREVAGVNVFLSWCKVCGTLLKAGSRHPESDFHAWCAEVDAEESARWGE